MKDCYFSFDIGGTSVKYALIANDFKVLERGEFPTPYYGVDELLKKFKENEIDRTRAEVDVVLNALVDTAKPYLGRVCGIGVSIPGTVGETDPNGTVYRGGALPFMNGIAVGKELSERMGVPCAVGNDGKSAVLGEYAAGSLKGCRSGAVVIIGTGIAGGAIIDGKIWEGANSFAGEYSLIFDEPDRWPDLSSLWGIGGGSVGLRNMVIEVKGLPENTGLTGREIFEMANSGDQEVIDTIRRFSAVQARRIISLHSVLDPEVIAIGGGISAQPMLHQLIAEELNKIYETLSFVNPPRANVVPAQGGNDGNLIGAAYRCSLRMS